MTSHRRPIPSRDASRAGLARLAVLVALAAFFVDVVTKSWAVSAIGSDYIGLGLVGFTVVQNPGLAFSSGAGVLSAPFVVSLRLTTLVVLSVLAWRFATGSVRFSLGFALLLAGGLGNAADVLFRDGAVVDFISLGPLLQATSSRPLQADLLVNVADVWVIAGLALLYPLFRRFGLAVQDRLRSAERRVLQDAAAS